MTPAGLPAALLVDRQVRRRAATEVTPLDGGLVVRHPELADVHFLNAILLDRAPTPASPPAPAARAAAVAELAERWQGDLRHRCVVFDDAVAGERLAAELAPAGWERRRTLYLTMSPERAGDAALGAAAADPRVREIGDDQLRLLQLAGLREEVPTVDARTGIVRRLVAAQAAARAATPAVCFGAGENGSLHAMGTLFLDDDVDGRRVALIEEVGTLAAHRERGLARAVVAAAIARAVAWGAELIVVPADADDWPQLMYARMGFEPAGHQVALTLRAGSRDPES